MARRLHYLSERCEADMRFDVAVAWRTLGNIAGFRENAVKLAGIEVGFGGAC